MTAGPRASLSLSLCCGARRYMSMQAVAASRPLLFVLFCAVVAPTRMHGVRASSGACSPPAPQGPRRPRESFASTASGAFSSCAPIDAAGTSHSFDLSGLPNATFVRRPNGSRGSSLAAAQYLVTSQCGSAVVRGGPVCHVHGPVFPAVLPVEGLRGIAVCEGPGSLAKASVKVADGGFSLTLQGSIAMKGDDEDRGSAASTG